MRVRPPLSLLYAIVLASEAGRGAPLPALGPLLIAAGGSVQQLGALVAAYPAAAAAATVPLGVAADAVGSPAGVLAAAAAVQAVGHALTTAASSPVALIAARAIVGIGAPTTPLARAVVTTAATATAAAGGGSGAAGHLAGLGAAQWAGAALSPGLAAAAAAMPGVARWGWRAAAVAPIMGLAVVLVAIAAALLLWGRGGDGGRPPSVAPAGTSKASGVVATVEAHGSDKGITTTTPAAVVWVAPPAEVACTVGDATKPHPLPSPSSPSYRRPPALVALSVSLLVNAALNGVVGALETVAVPSLTDAYGLPPASAGGLLSMVGVVGLIAYALFGVAAVRWRVRLATLMATGLAAGVVGATPLVVSAAPAAAVAGEGTVAAAAVPPPPLGVYAGLLCLLWGVAFPVGQTAAVALYGAALGWLPAGAGMAAIACVGYGSRAAAAVAGGAAWRAAGREGVATALLGTLLGTGGVVAAAWQHLTAVEGPTAKAMR